MDTKMLYFNQKQGNKEHQKKGVQYEEFGIN